MPISVNEEFIGKSLPFNIDNNNIIVNLDINTKQGVINFIDRVNNHLKYLPKKVSDKLLFDSTYKFYSFLVKKHHYVLAIKFIDDKTITKTLFNIDGFIINNITNYLLDNNNIKRVKHNTICTIKNNVVVHVAKNLSFVPLRVNKPKKKYFVVDRRIGAIYTETLLDFDGIHKVYALDYRTNLEDYPITFYIDIDTMDSIN